MRSLAWLTLLGVATGCAPDAEPPRAIVLLVVDTLRADRLSSYGCVAHTTPHIDGLAARGTRFTRAYAVGGWTVPSMGALFTALHPRALGLIERNPEAALGPFDVRRQRRLTLPAATPHLAESLREAGYRTAAFVDQPMLSPSRGFGRGFDDFFGIVERGRVQRIAGDDSTAPDWNVTLHAYENDAALIERFDAWLGADSRPAFAWLHLLVPHAPYLPPEPFAPANAGPATAAAYDGEVRAADVLVGRALEIIDEHIGLDRSLVVFASDHGEAFGEHGDVGHGQSLHAEITRVPLIIAGPGVPSNTVLDHIVSLLDVAPAVKALARTAADQQGAPPLFSGPSPSPHLFTEGLLYGPTERSWTEDGFRLIVDEAGDTRTLFELRSDPEEQRNLAAQHPERVRALEARLDAMRTRLDAHAPQQNASELSPADLEALRALGYVDDAPSPQ